MKTLIERIPEFPFDTGDVFDRFLEEVQDRKLELYPAQEEAILELFGGKNVILNTPTGSGKSLVATALHFKGLAEGVRSVYTCPIKALVNEKFMALCRDFGPDQVGMMTGDASVNREAPILCCTAEILSNLALRHGEHCGFQEVIIDEFHYYSDRDRGVAWQVPLLTLKNSRFLLMSATLGDTTFFERELTALTGRPTVLVRSDQRPVPLDFKYVESPLPRTIETLVEAARVPVYLVNFTQRECAEQAQNLMSVDFCTKAEKQAIAEALQGVKFSSPYGKEMLRFLKHGIGVHHAGLLPKYRVLVERLAQQGLLKVISGTDTLGVGVNVPIRTVLFTKLCKYDGQKTTLLSVRDFKQISGRAGRKGFDDQGFVVAQAPEHVIENLKLEEKAKKFVKRKPPEKGYVHWDAQTFERLKAGEPEALVSRFSISHGMLLLVLSRETDPVGAMRALIRRCHEPDSTKKKLRQVAFQLFRALYDRKIIEILPKTEGQTTRLRVNVELQEDFSLNQTLSLYLLDTIPLLDSTHPDFALDVLTLVESILEDPDLILRKQLDRIRTEKLAELKAQGMEYEERLEELEKLEYPKPHREFIYSTFNEFAAKHPWVGMENIRPKSVAREMVEMFQSFEEYIRDYELQRSEGLLLRYLSDVYKVLLQTVPEAIKTDELYSIIAYLGSMLKAVDSSLLEEWERLRGRGPLALTEGPTVRFGAGLTREVDPLEDRRAFLILLRNEIFRVVRALSVRDFGAVMALVECAITADELEARMKDYFAEHQRLCTDTRARAPQWTRIDERGEGLKAETWAVEQVLVDPEGFNDWGLGFEWALQPSREQGRPVLRLVSLQRH